MNANSTGPVVVEGGGDQVVAHVGLHAVGSLADRLGLGSSLSARVPQPRFRFHDRGKVLVQAMFDARWWRRGVLGQRTPARNYLVPSRWQATRPFVGADVIVADRLGGLLGVRATDGSRRWAAAGRGAAVRGGSVASGGLVALRCRWTMVNCSSARRRGSGSSIPPAG